MEITCAGVECIWGLFVFPKSANFVYINHLISCTPSLLILDFVMNSPNMGIPGGHVFLVIWERKRKRTGAEINTLSIKVLQCFLFWITCNLHDLVRTTGKKPLEKYYKMPRWFAYLKNLFSNLLNDPLKEKTQLTQYFSTSEVLCWKIKPNCMTVNCTIVHLLAGL